MKIDSVLVEIWWRAECAGNAQAKEKLAEFLSLQF